MTLLLYVIALPVVTLAWTWQAARAESEQAWARRATAPEASNAVAPKACDDGGAEVALPLQKHDSRGEAAQPSSAPEVNNDDVRSSAVAMLWFRRMLEVKNDASTQSPAPWRHTDPIVMPLVADFTVVAWCVARFRASKRRANARPRRLQVQQGCRPVPHTYPGRC